MHVYVNMFMDMHVQVFVYVYAYLICWNIVYTLTLKIRCRHILSLEAVHKGEHTQKGSYLIDTTYEFWSRYYYKLIAYAHNIHGPAVGGPLGPRP